MRSAILGEDRELQVSLPETYARTTTAYPVLFLLDGSSHLLHATATARFLASARNRIPELIVVAIPNRNRNRDMTPGAGAATFQRVLAEELIPWVEQHYRAAPERILSGHSLSASFAVHTLLNRPELFDAYVVASAPVWRYDNLAGDMKEGLARAAKARAAVYLTVGQHENERLREGVLRFSEALRAAAPGTAPTWAYVDMPDQDHSSTPERTLYAALEWRYAPYRFPFFENPEELDRAGGIQGLESHYARVGAQLGFEAPVPEARLSQAASILIGSGRHDDVLALAARHRPAYPSLGERLANQVGYDLLSRGAVDRAITAFKGNAIAFPDSPNAHDSLGDAYCRSGDAAAARDSYGRAVQAAERRSPPPARLAFYRDKAASGCAPAVSSKSMPDGHQWMTENAKVVVDGSYCYDDAEANCQRYGRLYTWQSAQQVCRAVGEGWRLPTNEDWQRMAKAFGGVRDDSADGGAAAFLALQTGGPSGFEAVLGGGRTPEGEYARLDAHGFYWTATETSPDRAWLYNIGKNGRILNRHPDGEKIRALAVRCIKN